MNGHRNGLAPINIARKARRSYRPRAEALEGRRLLSYGSFGDPFFFGVPTNPVGPTGVSVSYHLADTNEVDASRIGGAKIDWGDGTPQTDAKITSIRVFATESTFSWQAESILGTHAFAQSGTYHGTIHVTGHDSNSNEVHEDVPITLLISPAHILSAVGPSFLAAAGIPYQANDLGRFFTNIPDPANQVQGTTDWGDGSPSTAWDLESDSIYPTDVQVWAGIIHGAHTYAATGSYTVTTTITGAGVTVQTEAKAEVISQPLQLIDFRQSSQQYGYPDNPTWETTLGTTAILPYAFVDFSRQQQHTLTVDWGDGSPVSVVGAYASYLYYDADVSHDYKATGDYPVQLTVTNEDGLTATEATVIHVGLERLKIDAPPLTAIAGLDAGINVATITQLPFAAGLRTSVNQVGYSYTFLATTIDWGDGSQTSFPNAYPYGNGMTDVDAFIRHRITGGELVSPLQAAHRYALPGQYPVHITVSAYPTGNVFQADTTATVIPFAASAPPISGQVGGLSSEYLATAEIPNGSLAAGDYSASIDWGDGSAASPATITVNASQATGFTAPLAHLVVSGTHAYAAPGAYAVSIRIADSHGQSRTIATTATIAPAPPPVVVTLPPVVVVPTPPVTPRGHFAIVSRFGHPDGGKRVWIPDAPPAPARSHALDRARSGGVPRKHR
jgi:PKD repeat protein